MCGVLNAKKYDAIIVGAGPAGIAAACVYLSTRIMGDLRTQGVIAKEAQVTEVTVRNRYKELIECLDFLVL